MARKLPISGKKHTNIKPQKSRELIRKFHVLLKRQQQAPGDVSVKRQIEALGGLEAYQQASISGQGTKRGGDSSAVLVKWLTGNSAPRVVPPTLLEIGCLQIDNECARSSLFESIDRIDLNSQSPQIKKLDFMDMHPQKYGCLSLSLVLNFVPDPAGRGKMLVHTTRFLGLGGLLFFVLPAPCIHNSRYTTAAHLEAIFAALGYAVVETKRTAKIVYMLLRVERVLEGPIKRFPKKQLREGSKLNNFSIVI